MPNWNAIRDRIAALSRADRERLAAELAALGGRAQHPRLTAYFVPRTAPAPAAEDLRQFLAERLPRYMIPADFVALDALPRTPAGKLDRQALPTPPEELGEDAPTLPEPPRNKVEATLAAIWRDVLGLSEVSVHDNFFEVGGDSLLSIRILSRARREGIEIPPEIFFESPTIAELAVLAGFRGKPSADADLASGVAPLTPIQHWFFDNIGEHRGHWNQSLLLRAPADLDHNGLERIAAALIGRHDAFRLHFEETPDGWRQAIREASPAPVVSAETLPGPIFDPEIAAKAAIEFDLGRAPLVRFILLNAAGAAEKRLLIVAHHLVMDGVSWGILLEDLDTLYQKLGNGEQLSLPRNSVSALDWARRLDARAPEFINDAGYWLRLPDADALPVPTRSSADRHPNRNGQVQIARVGLESAASRAFLAAKDGLGRTNAKLLATLLEAWSDWTGQTQLLLDLESHGRDVLADELDASRTIGWFTTVFPVVLELDSEPQRVVESVRRQLEPATSKGPGHGILRYLKPDLATANALASKKRPQLLFNFVGRTASLTPAGASFQIDWRYRAPDRHPAGRRPYLLEINGRMEDESLVFDIAYEPELHPPAEIEQFAARFRKALASQTQAPPAEASSDYSLAGLDAAAFEALSNSLAESDSE